MQFENPNAFPSQRLALPTGEIVRVAKLEAEFRPWTGMPIPNTYGNKLVLEAHGEPVFAELAILRMLEGQGWQGVWVDTYRRSFRRSMPPSSVELPSPAEALFKSIVSANGGRRSGCWDVFAWKDDNFLFAESKRKGRDHIRDTQLHWFMAAMSTGFPPRAFCIVEWDVVAR